MRRFVIALMLALTSSLAAQDDSSEVPDPKLDRATTAAALDPLVQWLPAKLVDDIATDDELQKLLKERYRAAQAELSSHLDYQTHGADAGATADGTQRAVAHLAKAALALCRTRDEKIGVLKHQLKVRRHLEDIMKTAHEAGLAGTTGYHQARYLRLSAEVDLRTMERETKTKGK
jgi:hypothetical protein